MWRTTLGVPPEAGYGAFLDAAVRYGTGPDGTYGMKIQWMHVAPLARNIEFVGPPDEVLEHLFPGGRFVNVIRGDRHAQALSWFRAIETGEWWRVAGSTRVPDPPLLDPDEVCALTAEIGRQQDAWRRYFERRGSTALTVEYEQLELDYRGQIARVLAFLGLDPAPAATIPAARLVRQADDITEQWRQAMLGPAAESGAATGRRADRRI
jgi:LPS sulfotransferase NodH